MATLSVFTAVGLIPRSNLFRNFWLTIYALFFDTFQPCKLMHTPCEPLKLQKRQARKKNSGRCTTNYLLTNERLRIMICHATPGTSVWTSRDLRATWPRILFSRR